MCCWISFLIHRHPYIERLTQMYLMKLNFPSFGSNRGAAAWRQVLVAAIMPWFRKLRVFREERLIQSLQSVYVHLKEIEEDSKRLPERFGDDMKAVKDNAGSAGVAAVGGIKAVKDNAESAGVAAVGGIKAVKDNAGSAGVAAVGGIKAAVQRVAPPQAPKKVAKDVGWTVEV